MPMVLYFSPRCSLPAGSPQVLTAFCMLQVLSESDLTGTAEALAQIFVPRRLYAKIIKVRHATFRPKDAQITSEHSTSVSATPRSVVI